MILCSCSLTHHHNVEEQREDDIVEAGRLAIATKVENGAKDSKRKIDGNQQGIDEPNANQDMVILQIETITKQIV